MAPSVLLPTGGRGRPPARSLSRASRPSALTSRPCPLRSPPSRRAACDPSGPNRRPVDAGPEEESSLSRPPPSVEPRSGSLRFSRVNSKVRCSPTGPRPAPIDWAAAAFHSLCAPSRSNPPRRLPRARRDSLGQVNGVFDGPLQTKPPRSPRRMKFGRLSVILTPQAALMAFAMPRPGHGRGSPTPVAPQRAVRRGDLHQLDVDLRDLVESLACRSR